MSLIPDNLPITEREDTLKKLKALDRLMRKYYNKDPELKKAFQVVIRKSLYQEREQNW